MRQKLQNLMDAGVEAVFPAATLHVIIGGEPAADIAVGWPDPENRNRATGSNTLFDLASLTKLFTTTAFLKLVTNGAIHLDDTVSSVLPEFSGQRAIKPYEDPLNPGQFVTISDDATPVDAASTTCRQLLTHTSGLPAWRPIFQQPPELRRDFVLTTPFAYQPGTTIVYSDLGLILLGWVIERLTGQNLNTAIQDLVLRPLGEPNIRFGPLPNEETAPTEYCMWRGKRMHGEVHDENAWSLDGIAGHAGLFGTAAGVAALGQLWLNALLGKPDSLLAQPLAQEAVSAQVEAEALRRGLGWLLWSPDPMSMSHPLSPRSFGHTGFTGTSLMIDPDRELVIACLTNEVYNGRENRKIMAFRRQLHTTVAKIIL